MSAIRKKPVDAVLVGFGWTGAIMAMELAEAGLNVVALERGPARDTYPDFAYPKIADELSYAVRYKLMQNLAGETVTVRHTPQGDALPYRQIGSFVPGNGVGGAGVHWNGMHWRATATDLTIRSHYEARYGKKFIPPDMTIQDWGVTYDELEPFYDKFEYVCGVSGKAGNLQGKIIAGGNPFESPRARDYPLAPLTDNLPAAMFADAARSLGYKPFAVPASNASAAYTNPYGMQLGPCNFCGFCERFGCYMYAKAAPQTTIIPALMKKPNFELRTQAYVTRVNLDSTGKKATGVTYIDAQGREVEQPAELVVLSAYQFHNVRLLLLSKIGQPYDPKTGRGTVGKNYAYQMNGGVSLFFDQDVHLNPFIGSGAGGQALDEFNGDNFDHGPLNFIGGAYTSVNVTGGRPIQQAVLPPGTPTWGTGWKNAMKEHYLHSMRIGTEGSVMSYRDNFLDLDPTYRDAHGLPLLRMTFDWKDNDIRMTQYTTNQAALVGRAMKPKQMSIHTMQFGDHYDVRPYQSTHTTGGAIMGSQPDSSVVNKYLQSWDVPNVFVLGASAFPQNFSYNPTGTVGALAYWAAHAIRTQYLKNPGVLMTT
ncbi:GMC family oxidoreductase [Paraburkholderia bonniea]|uniref:GMC family oxidoreductase n=1 Tax=Paraburkholderia bonniea TaxID=2152891 RepID=UPI002573F8A6|nr:GMC family oxidoreductase [Paraburkholderia bonniea]WJF89174.1 GMC family oxidoreductase [Paraburkholderia bonniea]WJF92490.1 GMC family oxidoreductase [Paraburkholderia bonniea]